MKKREIVAVGDSCVDYYLNTNEAHFGGNAFNVAFHSSCLGTDTALVGAIGKDYFGEEMVKILERAGVDISHIHRSEGATAITEVNIKNGERIFGNYDEGVMEDFSLKAEDIEFIGEFKLLHSARWGRITDSIKGLSKIIDISFDFSDVFNDELAEKVLPFTDIAFFSEDNLDNNKLKNLMEDLYRKQISLEKKNKLLICMRGAKGSLIFNGKDFTEYGIFKTEIVDTMGAGDSYIGGFLSAFIKGENIKSSMKSGTKRASETLKHTSGIWF